MNKKLLLLLFFVCNFAWAQQNQIAKFFPAAAVPTGGEANVQALVSGFILPIGEDLGSLSNGGWYHTASNHKKWGFDLQVTMNTITAKSDQKAFSPGTLTGVQYDGTAQGSNQAPTAYGPESDFPIFHYTAGTNIPVGAFRGPGGGNLSADIPIGSLAVPTITGGLGLFANTDIRFRYTPDVNINGTKLKNWGIGLQHDIKQHIAGIKMAPFSLSLLLAYSSQTATTDLSGFYTGSGQEGVGDTKAYTGQILISKSIPVVTFYGGIGYNSSTTTYAINGTYHVDKTGDNIPLITPKDLTNPFKQEFSTSGFRATGGIRFNFGPIILNGDYTYFNSKGLMTLGFGFTVR